MKVHRCLYNCNDSILASIKATTVKRAPLTEKSAHGTVKCGQTRARSCLLTFLPFQSLVSLRRRLFAKIKMADKENEPSSTGDKEALSEEHLSDYSEVFDEDDEGK